MRVPSTYAYCRQSLGCDKQANSVEIQLKAAKDYYDRTTGLPPWAEHLTVLDRHSDSKINFLDRPAGKALLSDSIKGDVVIFAHLDRLGRTLFDMMATIEHLKKKSGLKLHVLDAMGKPLDLETPVGQIIVAALAFAASMERQRISERTKAAVAYLNAQGRATNHPQVGFQNVNGFVVPHPEEMRQIEEGHLLETLGWTHKKIRQEFHRRGYRVRGRLWSIDLVHKALHRYRVRKQAEEEKKKAM